MIKLILIRKNVRKRRNVWALGMHRNLTIYLLNNAVVYSEELHLQTKHTDIIYITLIFITTPFQVQQNFTIL